MAKRAFFLAAFCLIFAGALANSPIRMDQDLHIAELPLGQYESTLPVVNGVRSCGGKGKFVQLRYEPCNGTGICQVPGDGQKRRGEAEFIPRVSSSQLGVRFAVISDGEVNRVYDKQIERSQVEGGKNYVLSALAGISEKLKGKQLTVQYVIYRVDDNEVEVCYEADFEIV